MYKGEDKVAKILSEIKSITIEELARVSGMNPDAIRRIVESLRGEGYASISASEKVQLIPTGEFEQYAREGMPEKAVYEAARAGKAVSDLSAQERQFGLSWARKKGFVDIEKGSLIARKGEDDVREFDEKMQKAFSRIKETHSSDDPVLLDELCSRNLVRKKTERSLVVSYTGKALPEGPVGFDLSAPVKDAPIGKAHVITAFRNKVASIMAELGFEEMEGQVVESTFWCFDALFQPQDHPARELADTFYLKGEMDLPSDRNLVRKVKDAHEKGWKYNWSEKEAKRTVLRTHTTAMSARYLTAIKDKKPKKYFAIGRVFRNEATDFKHLAEFHQVEGIVAWEGATFRDLLGVLKEFYRKLGFEKIRFRPSFFPYTEPSLEVEVFFEPRGTWLELGGAGVFRPEVSIPLAGVYPVLAWGLSLERPLMLTMGLDDIRTFYRNDIDFLKKTRLSE